MSWLLGDSADRAAVLGLRPELAAAHAELLDAVRRSPVPPVVLELCRVRTAQLLEARVALAEPTTLTPDQVATLARWRDAPSFDATERACLAFAELFVVDHHAITDDQAAAVRDALGEPGLVALTTALAVWENQHRLDIALGVS